MNEDCRGAVVAPAGFSAAGVRCGLRKSGDERPDLALIYSETPAVAAGVFTRNRVRAAPVLLTMEHLAGGRARAIVVNAGVANACTGERGMGDARRMAVLTGELLDLEPAEVVVASTGVIGNFLPMDRVEAGIREAARRIRVEGDGAATGARAAIAITTTDTQSKERTAKTTIGGCEVTVGGMAKGSGMIRPDMATMLSFITTDAAVELVALHRALTDVVGRTFNMVTVDGDTSTNDMVVVLANGRAGNVPIRMGTPFFGVFVEALEEVCGHLAREIARDGEGATRLLEVCVTGAAGEEDARRAALAVAGSSLVKTAIFGADANWGRIVAALGYSGAFFDPGKVTVRLGTLLLVKGGMGTGFDEGEASALLSRENVRLEIELGDGGGHATAWGCDLTYDYVKINGSYRT